MKRIIKYYLERLRKKCVPMTPGVNDCDLVSAEHVDSPV